MDEIIEITLYELQNQKKRGDYSPTKLRLCLEDICSGKMSCLNASKVYQIPRTTLASKLNGYRPEGKRRPGPEPTLGSENESRIAEWVLNCSDDGYPIKRSQLMFTIEYVIDSLPLASKKALSFKGKPTKAWYRKFLKRYPLIVAKRAEYLSISRALVTEARIRAWFSRTEFFLDREAFEALKDPLRVFNADETAVWLNPAGDKVLARRSMVAYAINGNDEKVNVTVLFTVNANGSFICPTIVYKGVRKSRDSHIPSDWHVIKTKKGWMTCEGFLSFLRHIFLPYIESNNIKRPVVLFLDGHVSHISLPASEFCREFGIVLVCFLPAATHVLQPLDKAVFKLLKAFWHAVVDHFGLTRMREVTKFDVPSVMEHVLQTYREELRSAILSGFRSCGLFPWNCDAIKYDMKCKYGERVWWRMKDKNFEREVELSCTNDEMQPTEEMNCLANESSIVSCNLESEVGYYPSNSQLQRAEGVVLENNDHSYGSSSAAEHVLYEDTNNLASPNFDDKDTNNCTSPTFEENIDFVNGITLENENPVNGGSIPFHLLNDPTVEEVEIGVINTGTLENGMDDLFLANDVFVQSNDDLFVEELRQNHCVNLSNPSPQNYERVQRTLEANVTYNPTCVARETSVTSEIRHKSIPAMNPISQTTFTTQSEPLDLRKPLKEVNVSDAFQKSLDIQRTLKNVLNNYCPKPAPKKKSRRKLTFPVLMCDQSINSKRAAIEEKENEAKAKAVRNEEVSQLRLLKAAEKAEKQEIARRKKEMKAAEKAEMQALKEKYRSAINTI